MDTMIYILYFSLIIPIGLMMLLLKGDARNLVIFLMTGMTMCLLASEINPIAAAFSGRSEFYVTTEITPLIEEMLKALPVLFYAAAVSDERQNLLQISMAEGIGFALLENSMIMMGTISSVTLPYVLVRCFGSALMHGMSTLMVGYGISFVRKKRKLFYTGTFALLMTAITYHGIYNCLVQSAFPYLGILMPLGTFIPMIFWIWRKDRLNGTEENS